MFLIATLYTRVGKTAIIRFGLYDDNRPALRPLTLRTPSLNAWMLFFALLCLFVVVVADAPVFSLLQMKHGRRSFISGADARGFRGPRAAPQVPPETSSKLFDNPLAAPHHDPRDSDRQGLMRNLAATPAHQHSGSPPLPELTQGPVHLAVWSKRGLRPDNSARAGALSGGAVRA